MAGPAEGFYSQPSIPRAQAQVQALAQVLAQALAQFGQVQVQVQVLVQPPPQAQKLGLAQEQQAAIVRATQ